MSMVRPSVCFIVLSLFAGVPTLLAAESPSAGDGSAPVARSIAALQVAADPRTGRLIAPTPEQQAKLAAALARMIDQRTEGLEIRRLPNGMRLVDLDGRFRNVEVAVLGPNGAVHLRCIGSPEELQSPIQGESVPSPTPRPVSKER